jgi:hypothetical protein
MGCKELNNAACNCNFAYPSKKLIANKWNRYEPLY